MKKNIKGTVLYFFTIAAVVAIIVAIPIYKMHKEYSYGESLEFSQSAWENSPRDRWCMVDDLLMKYDFIGMSSSDVVDLLGKQHLYFTRDSMGYQTYGGFLHDESIYFSLNKDGNVIEIYIVS